MNVLCLSGFGHCPSVAVLLQQSVALVGYALGVSLSTRQITMLRDARLTELVDAEDKVAAFGAFNLAGEGCENWAAQMAAVTAHAQATGNSKHPLLHLVISFQTHERPSASDAEEAVRSLCEVLGATKLMVVWAMHHNTGNRHVHAVICRVDPISLKVIELANGWLQDALYQAAAVIEARGGWASEPNAVYRANPDGAVWHRATGRKVRDEGGRQLRVAGDRALELEIQRRDPEWQLATNIINTSESWPELHAELERRSLAYFQLGSGAAVKLSNGQIIKASRLSSAATLTALLPRLGPFQEDSQSVEASLDTKWKRLQLLRKQFETFANRLGKSVTESVRKYAEDQRKIGNLEQSEHIIRFQLLLLEFVGMQIEAVKSIMRTKKIWIGRNQPPDFTDLPLTFLGGNVQRCHRTASSAHVLALPAVGSIILDTAHKPIAIDLGHVVIAGPTSDAARAAVLQLVSPDWSRVVIVCPPSQFESWRAAQPQPLKLQFVDRASPAHWPSFKPRARSAAVAQAQAQPMAKLPIAAPAAKAVQPARSSLPPQRPSNTERSTSTPPASEVAKPRSLEERQREIRLAEARKRYPDPDVTDNPLVKAFITQLRSAPDHDSELYDIVSRIRRDAAAAKACYAIRIVFFEYQRLNFDREKLNDQQSNLLRDQTRRLIAERRGR